MTTFKYKNKKAVFSITADDEKKAREILDDILDTVHITDKNFKLIKNGRHNNSSN